MYLQPDTTQYLTKLTHYNELTVRTAIVDIDLILIGSEAHISRNASRGGGDLWIEEEYARTLRTLHLHRSAPRSQGLRQACLLRLRVKPRPLDWVF